MANISETATWDENVYEIAVGDPVLGGTDGPMNRAAQSLANRTQWLKQDMVKTSVVSAFTRGQYFAEKTLSIVAGEVDLDFETDQVATVTLTGDITLNLPTNLEAGATMLLRLKQDGTGGRTVSFDAGYSFGDRYVPEMPHGANEVMILSIYTDGTNVYMAEFWRSA